MISYEKEQLNKLFNFYDNKTETPESLCNKIEILKDLLEQCTFDLEKYDNEYQGAAFEAMTELNNVYGPYLKRPATECFYPEKRRDFRIFTFSNTTLKFKEVFSYDEALKKVTAMFPDALSAKYNASIQIGYYYTTKTQTIFQLYIALKEK